MTPEEIVQKQVEAYNNRDIDKFAACHDPEIELFNFSETIPYAQGMVSLKKNYGTMFDASPNLNTNIVNRIVIGNKVIDHEIVTGRQGVDLLEIVAIYEIEHELIKKAHFIRK